MAVVADRVIVELEARIARYEANVRRAEQRFDGATRSIEADAKRMARTIETNAEGAGAALRNLAGVAAAAFSAAQIIGLADSYTRLTNSLRVAGLEGQELSRVQAELLAASARNGVSIESLGQLYGGIAQSQNDLGASTAQIIQLTNSTAEALRITGTDAAQASGAILGLSQALAAGTVRAEEFNQINEGGLRPLLQAAASSEEFGGSVARLRKAVTDGKVSSEQFFAAVLRGSAQISDKASRANLTIAGSLEALKSSLTVYIGQTDEALGISSRLAEALKLLADNIDTVAEALGVLAALYVGRYVAGVAAATTAQLALRGALAGTAAQMGIVGAASFALQARMAGAATTAQALAFAARGAGASLLGAFGGPVGVAIIAVGGALLYATRETNNFNLATQAVQRSNAAVTSAADSAKSAIDRLASSYGAARREARALVEEQRKLAVAAVLRTTQELADARAAAARTRTAPRLTGGRGDEVRIAERAVAAQQADSSIIVASQNARTALSTLLELDRALAAPAPGSSGGSGASGGSGRPTRSRAQGRSAAETAARFADDQRQLEAQSLRALLDLTTNIEERAALQNELLALERDGARAQIEQNSDYTRAQKDALLAQLDAIYGRVEAEDDGTSLTVSANRSLEARRIALEAAAERERERAELADQIYQQEQNALQDAFDLAESSEERRRIALELVELEYRHREAILQAILASEAATEAEKERARVTLAALPAERERATTRAERDTESPLERYRRRLNRSAGEIRDEVESLVVDELQSVRDGIADAITNQLGIKNDFISGLLKLFLDEVLLKPIADALSQASAAGGGGSGGILGAISSVFGTVFSGGRASGGHVSAGVIYPVNERGIEGFRPAQSGQIIPLGRMRTAGGGGVTLNQTVNVDARGVNPDGFVEHIKQAVRQETVAIVSEATRATVRGVPGRLQQYNRDGV